MPSPLHERLDSLRPLIAWCRVLRSCRQQATAGAGRCSGDAAHQQHREHCARTGSRRLAPLEALARAHHCRVDGRSRRPPHDHGIGWCVWRSSNQSRWLVWGFARGLGLGSSLACGQHTRHAQCATPAAELQHSHDAAKWRPSAWWLLATRPACATYTVTGSPPRLRTRGRTPGSESGRTPTGAHQDWPTASWCSTGCVCVRAPWRLAGATSSLV